MKSDNKVYNILMPIWLLIFFPSWLWLILIPANYLIDRIVLRWSLGDMPEKGLFCRNHNWKICLAGFVSDFAGAFIMYLVSMILVGWGGDGTSFFEKVGDAMMFNPFKNVLAILMVAVAIALSAWCIYKLDNSILVKAGLDMDQAKKSAIRLAVITAPYVYLIPSEWFYN